jgi:hypothetical protein
MTSPERTSREPSFGYFLVPNASDPLIDTAQRVEQLGLDYVGIQDHPYQRNYVETWSLMAISDMEHGLAHEDSDFVRRLQRRERARVANATIVVVLLVVSAVLLTVGLATGSWLAWVAGGLHRFFRRGWPGPAPVIGAVTSAGECAGAV